MKCPKCSADMVIGGQECSIIYSNNFYGLIDNDSRLPTKIIIRIDRDYVCKANGCSALDKYSCFFKNIEFRSVDETQPRVTAPKEVI